MKILLLITALPALNFLLLFFGSRLISWQTLARAVIFNMTTALIYLVSNFGSVVRGDVSTTSLGNWSESGLLEINWVFSADALTYVMLVVVLTVSTLVHLYSTEYMSEDPHVNRFISYLSLFTVFMLVLVTSDNLVTLFLGWEGVGLCSYLLISFWFTRIQANKAAIKAMVVNRIADLALTIAIVGGFSVFQSVGFSTVFASAPFIDGSTVLFFGLEVDVLTLLTTLLFFGAMGKSAQIGLHTWLPDAMEGPTPVSALIHAATMVTAGVFLLVRASALFELAPRVLDLIAVVGAATALMAATSGLFQNDVKKVIAYSTCSQLGYMVYSCGLSNYALSLFHLANHAFFKALLFLAAGSIIHSISGDQDMRRFGALHRLLPYTYAMVLIGSLALMGTPFLTGYYSKDTMLEVAAVVCSGPGHFSYWLGTITAFFTAYYSLRLLNLVFYGESRSPRAYLVHTHELSTKMALALAALSLGAIFFGFLLKDFFIGLGTSAWLTSITAVQPAAASAQLAGEYLGLFKKLIPVFNSILAAALLIFVEYHHAHHISKFINHWYQVGPYRFLASKWGFDVVYNRNVNLPAMRAAYNTPFSLIDKGALEVFGPTGAYTVLQRLSSSLVRIQTGRVDHYALFMLVFLFLMLVLTGYSADVSAVASTAQIFFFASTIGTAKAMKTQATLSTEPEPVFKDAKLQNSNPS